MRVTALANALLLDPELPEPEVATLLVEGGRIAARLDPSQRVPEGADLIDLFGKCVAPGFIDVHFHGELIFCEPNDFEDALVRTCAELVCHGTTSFLITTVAWEAQQLRGFIDAATRALSVARPWGARALGLHLEGPWINPEAAGAQPAKGIRPFDESEAVDLLERAEGLTKLVTLAPEMEGALKGVELLERAGIASALGHSLASPQEIEPAIERGLQHVTHLFNAMGPFHHRKPGVAGHALADDRLSCDLICDGAHVHPAVVRLAARALGDRLILVTDGLRLPDRGPATSAGADENGSSGELIDDGISIRLPDGRLAGSALRLDRGVRNYREFSGVDLLEAVRACTLRPARLLGIEADCGTLRRRARADFAILDEWGGLLETWIEGRRVHERDEFAA